MAEPYAGNVPNVNRYVPIMADNDPLDLGDIGILAERPDHGATLAFAQIPALDIPILSKNRLPYLANGNPAGSHGLWIQNDMDLSVLTAKPPYRSDTADSLKPRDDHVLDLFPDFIEVFGGLDNNPGDRAFLVGANGSNLRLLGIRRQLCDEIKFLRNAKTGNVLVRPPIEFENNRRFSFDRSRVDLPEAFHGIEFFLQTIGDLAFYFQGGRSAILRLDCYLRAIHRRDHLNGETRQGDSTKQKRQ